MIQDSRGFLWIATEGGGVDVFDGQKFKNYSTSEGLPSNVVRCLFEDKTGNIWMGTENKGLVKFDGSIFTTYGLDRGLPFREVRSILQDDEGNIWVATLGGGVAILNPISERFSYLNENNGLPSNKVRTLTKDSQGNIWVGTDGGLLMSEQASLKSLKREKSYPKERILCLFEDGNQLLWIGTKSGVSRLNPKNGDKKKYTSSDGLINNRVKAIAQDKDGFMWFGTREGLSKFDGKNFVSVTEKQGLSNNRIRQIMMDASGTLWFGTFFGGIDHFMGDSFVHYTEDDGLVSHQVFAIAPQTRSNTVWLGTFEGLEKLVLNPDGKVKRVEVMSNVHSGIINALFEHKNKLWIGTDDGLKIYDGNSVRLINGKDKLIGQKVFTIHQENERVYWIGTNKGASRLEIDERDARKFEIKNPLSGKPVFSIHQDTSGLFWFGHSDGEFTLMRDGRKIGLEIPNVSHNLLQILPDPFNNTWIATEGDGVVRVNAIESLADTMRFQAYNTIHELASNYINLMTFDKKGNLWLGSEKGLDEVVFDYEQNIIHIEHYAKKEGFVGIETNKNAVATDSIGNVWFGTIKGITRFSHLAQEKKQQESYINITNVALSMRGTNWELGDEAGYVSGMEKRFNIPKDLILPPDENSLFFEFIGVSLKMPHKVEYQWMLENFDYDWNAPSQKSEIFYSNLPAGKYVFKVKASNADGIWNSEPAEFPFEIETPFWETYWFYATFILGTYLLFYSFFRWRTKQLAESKRKLEELVKERTQEVEYKNVALEQQKEEIITTLEQVQMQKETIEKERDTSDKLLLNILPKATAEELREKGYATPKFYKQVTIMFTDFKGFTQIAEKLTPTELVKELEYCFLGFDDILDKYDLEKIKTIGDSYMCAGGVPITNKTNPEDMVKAGLEIQEWMKNWQIKQTAEGKPFWDVRIGIHTGEVVAGVVGKKKFAYDIWGDAVNLASRMESSSEPNKVNISGATYELVKDKFDCEYRGEIQAKNKGCVDMYFVKGISGLASS